MIDEKTQAELRAKFNPDGSDLRRIQLRMLEMLKYVDKICRESNITYWLSSGTCLGAVRHEGFIPWDDDVDIEMLEDDYNRLIEILKNDTSSDFALQTPDNDPNYILRFNKLCDTKTEILTTNDIWHRHYRFKGVYIDIFALKPSNSRRLFLFAKKFNVQVMRLMGSKSNTIRRIGKWFHNFNCIFIYPCLRFLNSIGAKETLRHKIPNSFPSERILSEVIPTQRVKFEDTELPIPSNADAYLRRIYGDYMTLPNVDEHKIHVTQVRYL